MRTVIFDFDGVIADSTDAVLKSLEQIAVQKKVEPISRSELFALCAKDLFKRLKIRWFQIPYYVTRGRNLVKIHKDLMKAQPEFVLAIHQISQMDLKVQIMSSNSKELILEFNKNNFPAMVFSEVLGGISLFSKHKEINKFLKKQNIHKNHCIYVGDEVRDIIAARRSGIQSVAVLWGKDNEKLLSAVQPTFIARSGQELSDIIANFVNGT